MEKARVAIPGSGNIATGLMIEVGRHEGLEMVLLAGIDPDWR